MIGFIAAQLAEESNRQILETARKAGQRRHTPDNTRRWEKARGGGYWYYGTSVISAVSCGKWKGYRLTIRGHHIADYFSFGGAANAHAKLTNPNP